MLRNYFAAAIRNLFRNRAYAAINILGLALGFAAVILIGLFVRDEYSYDSFFPDHERIYRVEATVNPPSGVPQRLSVTASNIAPAMKLDFPEVEIATRLSQSMVVLRHGDIEFSQQLRWADPNFFRLFPMKTLSGDLLQALDKPDGLVLTRSMARKLFGRDDVVGETLELNRQHSMRVAAVIEDLPSNTHFSASIFGAGIASFSRLTALDAAGSEPGASRADAVHSYVRLRSGTRMEAINTRMQGFSERHVKGEVNGFRIATAYTFSVVPIAEIHLGPRGQGDGKPPGDQRTLHAMVAVGFLILFVAGSNFVSMMTARASRRAVEVGVRKAVGATRRQIMVQFLGECLFYAGLAIAIAVIAVQLTMPAFNGFLQREIHFDLRDPLLAAAVVAIALTTGLTASVYPALVLSVFRPSAVLKGIVSLPGGSGRARQTLVIFQFATLIALIVSTITIQRQIEFAREDRLRFPADEIYFARSGCPAAFMDSVANLPGILLASCASGSALNIGRFGTIFTSQDGGNISFKAAPLDYGFLDLFAITPIAGRPFAQDHGEDDVLRTNPTSTSNPSIAINESGARALGYSEPKAAVGQHRRWIRGSLTANGGWKVLESQSSQIIAVVPDFSLGSVRDVIEPTAYYIGDSSTLDIMILKLDGRNIPATLRATRALWAQQSGAQPLEGRFVSQYANDLYADIQKQSAIFSAFSGVAVVIAILGLLGLAVFTAERRTREIGLRKVMGASRRDILHFLAWQFTRPVLWANLIAWPAAYFFMQRWLDGFAYHIDQNPLVFVVASSIAIIVAIATVSGHALLVARAKPAAALRYE